MAISIALALGLSACGGGGSDSDNKLLQPSAPEALQPTQQGDTFAVNARGLWELSGMGAVIHIDSSSAAVYNISRDRTICWRDVAYDEHPEVFADLAGLYARRSNDMVFTASREGLQFHAKPLSALPDACKNPPGREPLAIFDTVASLMTDFYTYADAYRIRWQDRISTLRPQASQSRNEEELKPVLHQLLAMPMDRHTGIDDDSGMPMGWRLDNAPQTSMRYLREAWAAQPEGASLEEWMAGWNERQTMARIAQLKPDAAQGVAFGGMVVWGILDNNVGYLSIASMGGFSEEGDAQTERDMLAKALDQALSDLKGTNGLVLDIATNGGGLTEMSHDIAARFADQRRLAYTRALPLAKDVEPQPFYNTPGGNVHYAKPVVVLTSDLTASAAEYLLLLMRTLPQVRQAGQTTQGSFAGSFGKTLPNGWAISVANHVVRDAAGVNFEAVGVAPHARLDVFKSEDVESSYPDAVKKAALLVSRS